MGWKERYDAMSPDEQRLSIAVLVSVVLHGLLLTIKFVAPQVLNLSRVDTSLEVVLVNASTPNAPVKPDVLAQVTSEGGGNHDAGRASSPLVASTRVADGDAVIASAKRVRDLEEEQRRLMAIVRTSPRGVASGERNEPVQTPQPALADEELKSLARMQAQIEKQIEDYNKRPKRMTFGVNAKGVHYARYVEMWRDKIEKLGTQLYPAEARGKIYGSLIATAEIARDGTLVSFRVDKSSGKPVLDKAAERIVRLGAPYGPFPPEMAVESDILQITRTFSFTNDMLTTQQVSTSVSSTGVKP